MARHRFTKAELKKAAKATNSRLTAEERSANARKAVNARWAKRRGKPDTNGARA